MKYPSIERIERVFEECTDEIDQLKDEVDRLSALVPKVVVPKQPEYSDMYQCECGTCVGAIDPQEFWPARRDPYCRNCGERMDWDKVEVVK